MASEYDNQVAARHHQDQLLAEAALRRLTRTVAATREDPRPADRRLWTLLRRIAGAPSLA